MGRAPTRDTLNKFTRDGWGPLPLYPLSPTPHFHIHSHQLKYKDSKYGNEGTNERFINFFLKQSH